MHCELPQHIGGNRIGIETKGPGEYAFDIAFFGFHRVHHVFIIFNLETSKGL